MIETKQWRIANRFSDRRSQIVDRLVADAEFRALCRDYDTCSEALARFQNQSETLPERIREYERLLSELETDVRRALDSNPTTQ